MEASNALNYKVVEHATIVYVRDFLNPYDDICQKAKEAKTYNKLHEGRREEYEAKLRNFYQNDTELWVKDKQRIFTNTLKGLPLHLQDHYANRNLHKGKHTDNLQIKAFQKKTTDIRLKVNRIIKRIGDKLFKTVSQLFDAAEKKDLQAEMAQEEEALEEEAREEEALEEEEQEDSDDGDSDYEDSEEDEDEIGVRDRSVNSVRGEERKRKREVEDVIEEHKIVIEEKDRVYNNLLKEKEDWIKQKKNFQYDIKSCIEEKEKIVKEMKVIDLAIQKRDMELHQRDKEIKNLKKMLPSSNENNNLM